MRSVFCLLVSFHFCFVFRQSLGGASSFNRRDQSPPHVLSLGFSTRTPPPTVSLFFASLVLRPLLAARTARRPMIPVSISLFRLGRDRMAKNLDVSLASDIKKTVAFAVQIYLAYMLMVSERSCVYTFSCIILRVHNTNSTTLAMESKNSNLQEL